MLVGELEFVVCMINFLGVNDIFILVQLQDVEFVFFELGLIYVDVFGCSMFNCMFQDCDGNEIVVCISGFVDFVIDILFDGNGMFIVIFNVFGDIKQLFFCSVDFDVDMIGMCCNVGMGEEEFMIICELWDVFVDGGIEGFEDWKICGVVIFDNQNGNFDGWVVVVQDGIVGIIIFFQGDYGFSLGEEIEVVVFGQEFLFFNDLLQFDFINNDLAIFNGMGDLVEFCVIIIGEVLDNVEAWEFMLVQINGVSIFGSVIFIGVIIVNDGFGSIMMFICFLVIFVSFVLLVELVDMMVIVLQFIDYQLVICNLEDVGGEIGGGGGDFE